LILAGSSFPTRRFDLTGGIEEPLTVQWAGDPAFFQATLLGKRWRAPARADAASVIMNL
jgi:hypothetical protein